MKMRRKISFLFVPMIILSVALVVAGCGGGGGDRCAPAYTPNCSSNADCDDGNAQTYDVCSNPNTGAASCVHKICCTIQTTPDTLEPNDGINLQSATPSFLWREVSCAQYYYIDIRNQNGDQLVSPGKLFDNSYFYSGPALVDNEQYAWSITAFNGCGSFAMGNTAHFAKVPAGP
jgi:hypothetical protein